MTVPLPYLDPSLPVADRIADLLGRMTVEEKIGQMLQLDARDDLEEQVLRMHAGSILHASPERVLRARELTRQTRLGIPLLVSENGKIVKLDPFSVDIPEGLEQGIDPDTYMRAGA